MSSNFSQAGQSSCPRPFLEAGLFPETDGFLEGRFCSNLEGMSCCLPCPHTKWLYPDNFESMIEKASWINVPGLMCSIFLIASFVALPVSKTHRHYLSVCLVTSVAMMNIAFLIPLGAKPAQCDDAITPNDMRSSSACAISGALVIAGGWFGVMWVCLMTLALHLQICWQLVVDNVFMCGAITAGCTIPIIGLAVTLSLSGVSFRFGNTCHVNAQNSLLTLWIPLLLVSSLTLFMQLATFIYCLRVYFASLGEYSAKSSSSSSRSLKYKRNITSPKQAYQRIRTVIEHQWRGILIVLVIVADVIFFAIVFVSLNQVESVLAKGNENIIPWLNCLVETGGDKEICFLGNKIPRISEATVMSVLVLLSLNGFWCLLLLGRYSMIVGWWELISGKSRRDSEIISTNGHVCKDPANYEMLANMKVCGGHQCPITNPPKAVPYSSQGRMELPDTPFMWSSAALTLDHLEQESRTLI
ncbi:putative g-protein coupled receptor [Golovinomyces cichoracearum]|uniref:Putative g-protein coupled receptor n=1 Tax=Golovinomyces cichoracearum TaxID=62708 RepID=A0A420H7J2_9PEZI|nr:putative g-protein coupled receptor [Golovinomyces cichoracearum]